MFNSVRLYRDISGSPDGNSPWSGGGGLLSAATSFSPLGTIIGGIGGLISPISKLFLAHRQMKMANAINVPAKQFYKTSPFAQANQGLATNMFNGRMAGAGQAEANNQAAEGNALATAERGSTDSSQLLATAAGIAGQTGANNANLAAQEGNYKQGQAGLLMNANRDLTTEGDKVFQDQNDYRRELQGQKNQLMNAAFSNGQGAASDFGSGLAQTGGMIQNQQMLKNPLFLKWLGLQ